jgi:hypothetical protein
MVSCDSHFIFVEDISSKLNEGLIVVEFSRVIGIARKKSDKSNNPNYAIAKHNEGFGQDAEDFLTQSNCFES